MQKPKLTLLIPLAMLFVLISSSVPLGNQSNATALPAMGYHPDTNAIVLATPGVGLEQINEGPWIFALNPAHQLVDLWAYAIDSDVEDADLPDGSIFTEHGLWKCEWWIGTHLIETDTSPSDYGVTDIAAGSVREFYSQWDITTATTGTGKWLTTAGQYDIIAKVYDLAGNSVTTTAVSVWIDPREGLDFTVELQEWAYMAGDLMRFTTTVVDVDQIELVEIAGPDGVGGSTSYAIAETNDYFARNTPNNIFRYSVDELLYEFPHWLYGANDGLYNFTFRYTQATGLFKEYTIGFDAAGNPIELDDYARPIDIVSIRGFRQIGSVWTEFNTATTYFKDGDKIELNVTYDDTFYPAWGNIHNQNGSLFVDYSAIDSSVASLFVLNKFHEAGIIYDALTDSFAHNHTIVTAVADGDYYLPVYSKSILGHTDFDSQSTALVQIDNDAIDFDWAINSPTGIYSNGDTIYITIDLDVADPTAWIETIGPFTVGGAGNYPGDNQYGAASAYLTTGFTTEWDNNDEADIAKLDADTFHIQFTFDVAADPNRDGFWYVNVTVGDGNPNTDPVTKSIPIFYDYELGDLEVWNVRYPDIHPNSVPSQTLNVDLDGDAAPSAAEFLNSKIEVVVTGRVPGKTGIVQGVQCNELAYVVGYNTSKTFSSSVTKETTFGQNYVVFENVPDCKYGRNISVQAKYAAGIDTYKHYMNATAPTVDNCYTNFPANAIGDLINSNTPPVISGTYATSVVWQSSTSQYTAKPNVFGLTWTVASNDGAGSLVGTCKIFNTTQADPGDHVITGWTSTFSKTVAATGGSVTQVDYGGILIGPAPNYYKTSVDWYFFVNSSDANGHVVYYNFKFTTDNKFDDAAGNVIWTPIANTVHSTSVQLTASFNDDESDIVKLEVYYTRNAISHVNPVFKVSPDPTPTTPQKDAWTYTYTFINLANGDYNFYVVPFDSLGHTPLMWPAGTATATKTANQTWYIEKPATANITSPLDYIDTIDGFDADGILRTHFGPTAAGTYMGALRNGMRIEWTGTSNGGTLEYLVLNDTNTDPQVGAAGLWGTSVNALAILRTWSSTASYTLTGFHEGGQGAAQPFRIFVLARDSLHLDPSQVKTADNGLFYTCNARNVSHSNTPTHQEDVPAEFALMQIEFYIDGVKPIIDSKTYTEGTGAGQTPAGKVNVELESIFKGGVVKDTATLTDDDLIRIRLKVNSTGGVTPDPDGDDFDVNGQLYILYELAWSNGTVLRQYDFSNGVYLKPGIGHFVAGTNVTNPYGGAANIWEFEYELDKALPGWSKLAGALTINVYVFDYAMLMAGDAKTAAPRVAVTVQIDLTSPTITIDYVNAAQQNMYAEGDTIALKVTTDANNWTVTADFSEFDASFSASRVYVEDTCANKIYYVTYTITDTTALTSGWKNVTVTVQDPIGRAGSKWFETGLDAGISGTGISLTDVARLGSKFVNGYLYLHQGMNVTLQVTAQVTTKDHFKLNDDSWDFGDGYNLLEGVTIKSITGGKADNPKNPLKWYDWNIALTVPADLPASNDWSRVTLMAFGSPTQVDPNVDSDMWWSDPQGLVYETWVDNEVPEITSNIYGGFAAAFVVKSDYDYSLASDNVYVYRTALTGTPSSTVLPRWNTGDIVLPNINYLGYIDGVPTGNDELPEQADGSYYGTYAGALETYFDVQDISGARLLYYPKLIGWDGTAPTLVAGSFNPTAVKPTGTTTVTLTVADVGSGVAVAELYMPVWDEWFTLQNLGSNTFGGTVYTPWIEGSFETLVYLADGADPFNPNDATYFGPVITVDASAPGINAFVASDYTPVEDTAVTLTIVLDDTIYDVQMTAGGASLVVTQDGTNPYIYTATFTPSTAGVVGVLATVADDVWTSTAYLLLDVQPDVSPTVPVITSFTMSGGFTGDEITFAVSAYDNDPLTITVYVDGTALTASTLDDTWTWTATAGLHTAKAVVSDGDNTVEQTMTFIIKDRPKVPIDPVYWMGGAIILIMLVGLGLMFLRKGGAA